MGMIVSISNIQDHNKLPPKNSKPQKPVNQIHTKTNSHISTCNSNPQQQQQQKPQNPNHIFPTKGQSNTQSDGPKPEIRVTKVYLPENFRSRLVRLQNAKPIVLIWFSELGILRPIMRGRGKDSARLIWL
jgi:hypothetical protein